MASPLRTAYLGRATLANSAWYLDQLITFLTIGEETDGRFALVRVHGVRGAEPFPHAHTAEDEILYLLAGELTVQAGGKEIFVQPGETVTIPRGVEHTLRIESAEAQLLLHYSPAGFERYFHELSEPAEYLGLPPHPSPPDIARLVTTAVRYGCTVSRLP